MRQRPYAVLAFLALLASAGAHSVELGETRVRSHIGQPLSADIELNGMENDKAPLQAALADMDVYRGANIAMHPALTGASISVIQREGKRYLRISSPRRVESELVNVFFELIENGQRSVRQVTLWLKADPSPAPPPAAEVIAAAAPPPPPVRAPIVAPILRAASPVAPAACVAQFSAAQIASCTALDAKNVALKTQILDLEEKVKRLTVAMQAGALVPAVAAPAVATAAPKPLPSKLTPMGAPEAKPAGSTPWLFIGVAGAVVFVLIGLLLLLLTRKRNATKVKPQAKVGLGFIASVKNRLLPAKNEFSLTTAEEPAAG
ncbi:type IV pilus assembly protein FimV [Massilia sp. TWR1-2-2]|uniref:type IV pilus assembly protein FimV n=1 Tax=Massilia sp. TWR1-2-2 TaxID=2804584 RepID=UPI003CF72649